MPFWETIVPDAIPHVHDIVFKAMGFGPPNVALIVADHQCDLSQALGNAYRTILPDTKFIDFDETSPEDVLVALNELKQNDLAILIQSSSFRLSAFRLRIELFARGVKVVEHVHLAQMPGEQAVRYIESLNFEGDYFLTTGNRLKECLDRAQQGKLYSGEHCLRMDGPFEEAMRNVGDYSDRKNVGGQFPVGEVFTESKDLTTLNGLVDIFAYGDSTFKVVVPETPITLVVENGVVMEALNSNTTFDSILAEIRAVEGVVWVREIGFGLNRAFTKERRVDDIGTYERMCGIHFSLGAKHPVYPKPQFSRRNTRYHVDVFADTKRFELDGEEVYGKERYFPNRLS